MQLDSEGWLPIDELIENANHRGHPLSLELLHEVVRVVREEAIFT